MATKANYGDKFYKTHQNGMANSANVVLPIVLNALPPVNSAVDFGCGIGAWLAVLKEKGVADICGLDGDWVKPEMLQIPTDNFRAVDFEKDIALGKKYDLAMSLEVAEHLSEAVAAHFVKSLTEAADFVLFSAAIPGQGGKGHINERWQDYWVDLFAAQDYAVLDIVRPAVWDDENVETWYAQNSFLFVRQSQLSRVTVPDSNITFPIRMVHPRTYVGRVKPNTVKGAIRPIRHALKYWIRKKLNTAPDLTRYR